MKYIFDVDELYEAIAELYEDGKTSVEVCLSEKGKLGKPCIEFHSWRLGKTEYEETEVCVDPHASK